MATLLIEDLKESVDLDREAMRTIVGAGKRVGWLREPTPLLLVAVMPSGPGLRAASLRWSAFLRPTAVEPLIRKPTRPAERSTH
jgi:hypothetical protein